MALYKSSSYVEPIDITIELSSNGSYASTISKVLLERDMLKDYRFAKFKSSTHPNAYTQLWTGGCGDMAKHPNTVYDITGASKYIEFVCEIEFWSAKEYGQTGKIIVTLF